MRMNQAMGDWEKGIPGRWENRDRGPETGKEANGVRGSE